MLGGRLTFFCCLLIVVSLFVTAPALAAGGEIKLVINGQEVKPDVPPVISKNRTLVPLRVISEGLGAQVAWNGKTRTVTVTAPGWEIKLVVGQSQAVVNGQSQILDAPAVIMNNRTLVPLRFIGEALGTEVSWDGKTRTVTVTQRRAEITAVRVRPEVGREVIAVSGSGQLKGTAVQSGSEIIVKLPGALLKMPAGSVPVDDALIKEVTVSAVGTETEPATQIVIALKEPTPFTLTSLPGELAVVLPHRVDKLEYQQVPGGEVLTVTTTGKVAYVAQQLAAPDRLVLDLPGVVPGAAARELTVGTPLTERLLLEEGAGGVRLTLQQNRVTKFRVVATPTGLEVYLAAQITGLEYSPGPGGGEVRIHATGPVSYRESRLSDPERLVLDFPGVVLATSEPVLKVGDNTVREVRAGQFAVDPDVARVVVELTAYVSHEVATGTGPGDVVLKVVSSPVFGRYIAVDAGHGGQEPGAIGQTGLMEKDVNLDIAIRLAALLRTAGAKVFMIRADDSTLDFRVRPDLVNKEGVEALVSIHCNSFTDRSKRGTEVYYYREGQGGQKLAEAIHSALIPVLGLPDRGVRTAEFNVLKYTRMPAALVEVAYISNEVEERLLADPAFREKAAQGIFAGILSYFQNR